MFVNSGNFGGQVTMPYVDEEVRKIHEDTIEHFKTLHAGYCTAGELTYLLTALTHCWIKGRKFCFLTLCTAMGVLFCTALELYRKVVAPYEDKKIVENGSVSELDGGAV